MDLLNLFSGETGDFLQNVALCTGDKDMLQRVTGLRIASAVWNRVTGEQEIEALRNQTILNISQYVKDHPKASKEEMVKEIGKQIYHFQKQVEQL
ncbi:hypothetical protein SNE40_008985 [Patella caerulea]|uniref:Uncharacterized protein n=1 Tax=Patella caerulea TaxID=87958 RepID=A0AAN8PX72_PATCE